MPCHESGTPTQCRAAAYSLQADGSLLPWGTSSSLPRGVRIKLTGQTQHCLFVERGSDKEESS